MANSDLEYHGEPLPTIEYVSKPLLQVFVYGEETVATSELNGSDLPEVLGAYNERVIYLPEGYGWTLAENHVVLHELVHYLQELNGITDECTGNLEPQAYKLHDKWMVEHNSPADRPDMLFVMMLAMSCVDRHHYDGIR